MNKTVGQFRLEGDALSGPAEYMEQQGSELLRAILAGEDMMFNSCAHLSPDPETAVLVRLQTDYAGWKGFREFNHCRGAAAR